MASSEYRNRALLAEVFFGACYIFLCSVQVRCYAIDDIY
jgi:hypothetical protein